MTFATRSRSEPWSHRQLAGNESASICWPWPPISVTSTSMLPTGTWKPRPNSCARLQSLPKAFCKESGLDFPRTAYRSIPPRASCRHRGAGQHTCDSYAYSFQSLFAFASQKLKVAPSALLLEQLDAALISTFLEHLETSRGNSAETRNIRLAAIRSFFRFLQHHEPAARSNKFAVFWRSHSRKPTTVWWGIWFRKKCRPCWILRTHLRGRGFEIEPCYTSRCALVFASQN